MPRLPTPGGDNGNWGEILNEYLSVSHASDGTLLDDSVGNSQIKSASVGSAKLQDSSVATAKLQDGAITTAKLDDSSVTRVKLADGLKDDLDSKLENITGHISSGTNITMTGLGTLASPYLISSSNSGGDVVGPGTANDNALVRFNGTTGRLIKSSSATLDDSGKLSLSPASGYLFTVQSSANAQWTAYNNGAEGRGQFRGERYRGTEASPAAVQTDDAILSFAARAYDGNNVQQSAGLDFRVDGAPTASSAVPMRIGLVTGTNATDRAERLTIKNDGKIGIGTTAPTHSLTLPSTTTGSAHYNTVDQTTNYERARAYWNNNGYIIGTEAGGSGTPRSITISSGGNNTYIVGNGSQISTGVNLGSISNSAFVFQRNTTANDLVEIHSTGMTKTSGMQYALRLNPVIAQSGSAGYGALLINPSETSTGTGSKLLADFQVGGTSKTRIDNTGSHILSNGGAIVTHNTSDETTNYERNKMSWSNDMFRILNESSGTGTGRLLQIGTGGTLLTFAPTGSRYSFAFSSFGASTVSPFSFTGTLNGATLQTPVLGIQPTISQSGSAGYTALLVNPTESGTGSGNRLLADFQVGGTSKTRIDNTGTHVLSNGAGVQIYNTTDETTNYERTSLGWANNIFQISNQRGGTGSLRSMQFASGGAVTIQGGASATSFTIASSANAASVYALTTASGSTLATGTQSFLSLTPNYAQTGSAGYTAMLINVTDSSTSSGAKSLMDLQVGGSSKFNVSNSGTVTLASQKITGLANGTNANDAATFGQIPVAGSGITNSGGTWSVSTGGSTTVTTVTTSTYTFPATNGVWKGTLQASCTFSLPSVSSGGPEQIISALFIQDSTGGRAVTLPNGSSTVTCLWASGVTPTLPTTANSITKVIFQNIDGQWFGMLAGQNYS